MTGVGRTPFHCWDLRCKICDESSQILALGISADILAMPAAVGKVVASQAVDMGLIGSPQHRSSAN